MNDSLSDGATRYWKSTTLERFNLAVIGGTGVGKSTLLNAVFGEEVAPTGIGRPVTKGVDFYVSSTGTLGIYDFEGSESFAALNGFVANFEKIYSERVAEDPKEAIHAVWYCIKESDRRLDDQQILLINRLRKMGVPVALVMTQTPWRPESGYSSNALKFMEEIRSRDLPILTGRAIPVAAIDDEFHNTFKHGLVELVEITRTAAETEGVKTALDAAQRVDLRRKRQAAGGIVLGATTSAAAVAAVPIPLADAAVLLPLQAGMMSVIAKVFNVELGDSAIHTVVTSTLLPMLGKAAAAQLLKLFPGVGSALNATIAGALTGAAGLAWVALCEKHFLGELDLNVIEASVLNEQFMALFEDWQRKQAAEEKSDA